jgi:hypothetical protein
MRACEGWYLFSLKARYYLFTRLSLRNTGQIFSAQTEEEEENTNSL